MPGTSIDWVTLTKGQAFFLGFGADDRGCGLYATMADSHRLPRLPIFLLLIAVSLFVGWFIPDFYIWTGSDQSRALPVVAYTALGFTAAVVIICVLLPWLPIRQDMRGCEDGHRCRFGIRSLLIAVSVIAIMLAGMVRFPTAVSSGLCGLGFCYTVWCGVRDRQYRLPTAALLACMILPYVWILTYDERSALFPDILWLAAGLAAFLPSVMIGMLVGEHPTEMSWLSMLLTGVEMVAGACLIRLGPKRTIAYLLFVLLTSTTGSFGLHAGVRA